MWHLLIKYQKNKPVMSIFDYQSGIFIYLLQL